jgi:hypothetical protein
VRRIPVTYVVVPEVRMRIIRVDFHPSNKRDLVQAIRAGKAGIEVGSRKDDARTLWSKARVQRHTVTVA